MLVVEDESLVAMMLADMLGDLGCSVVGPLGTRTQALQAVTDGEPVDLALLDVNLGGDSVYEVAEALRRRRVPYAFVSGYGAAGIDSEACRRAGSGQADEPALRPAWCPVLGAREGSGG